MRWIYDALVLKADIVVDVLVRCTDSCLYELVSVLEESDGFQYLLAQSWSLVGHEYPSPWTLILFNCRNL